MSLMVVAVAAVVTAAASASASVRELYLPPSRWEFLSLLFPRFQISLGRARESFPSLSFSDPRSGGSQTSLASFSSVFLMFSTYAYRWRILTLPLFVKPFPCHVSHETGGTGECASKMVGRFAFESPTDPETVSQITFVSKRSFFANLVVHAGGGCLIRETTTVRKQRTRKVKRVDSANSGL